MHHARLEAAEDRNWNIEAAHEDDYAKLNASCLRAAEERLVEQEILRLLSTHSAITLWGITKFYDSVQYDTLADRCTEENYGLLNTSLTMMVHAAPRVLNIGKAVGKMLPSVGRSISAGCGRSQSFARSYTNKSVNKLRSSYGVAASGNTEANGMRVFSTWMASPR